MSSARIRPFLIAWAIFFLVGAEAYCQTSVRSMPGMRCEDVFVTPPTLLAQRLGPGIPVAFSQDHAALVAAVAEVQKITYSNQEATKTMQNILVAFNEVSDFNPRSLSLFIKHKRILKKIRDGYNLEVRSIRSMVTQSLAEGRPLRDIAEDASVLRRNLGEKYKNLTPIELREQIYGRNLRRYNDELGPTFEQLLREIEPSGKLTDQTYWEVIAKSQSPNIRLNRLLEILSRYTL